MSYRLYCTNNISIFIVDFVIFFSLSLEINGMPTIKKTVQIYESEYVLDFSWGAQYVCINKMHNTGIYGSVKLE